MMKRLLMPGVRLRFRAAFAAYPDGPSPECPFAAAGDRRVARDRGRHMCARWASTGVENVTGAGGTTGPPARPGARTATLIMMGHMGTHGAAPAVYPNLKYDPLKDFAPSGCRGTPILIVAKKDLPPRT